MLVLLDSGAVRPCEPMQFSNFNINVHVATEKTNSGDKRQKAGGCTGQANANA